VLVVDELGYLPLDQASANWIFEVVRRRYQKASTVLTSNRGPAIGAKVFANSVVATAIVDRLLHSATVVNVRGRSYRMRAHQDAPDGKTADVDVTSEKRQATAPQEARNGLPRVLQDL
jgi:DNA replication protein DnaC